MVLTMSELWNLLVMFVTRLSVKLLSVLLRDFTSCSHGLMSRLSSSLETSLVFKPGLSFSCCRADSVSCSFG